MLLFRLLIVVVDLCGVDDDSFLSGDEMIHSIDMNALVGEQELAYACVNPRAVLFCAQ